MKKAILLFAIVAQAFGDGQPLVEVARKMKAIEEMQPQINDMERRISIKESVNPVLDNAIKMLQTITNVSGMGRRRLLWDDIPDLTPTQEYVLGSMQEHVNDIHEKLMVLKDMPRVPVDVPSVAVSDSRRRLTSRAWDTKLHSCQQCAKGVESTCKSLGEFTCESSLQANLDACEKALTSANANFADKVARRVDDATATIEADKNRIRTMLGECLEDKAMLTSRVTYFEGVEPAYNNTARKMKAIEGMQPQINDLERRLGIMQSVEPVLENVIKTLQKVVDVRGMGRRLSDDGADLNIVKEWSLQSSADWPEAFSWDGEKFPEHRTPLQRVSDMHIMLDYILANMNTPKISGSTPMLRAKMLKDSDGQPLVEVHRKMKAIEGMQPQINDMDRRLGGRHNKDPDLADYIKLQARLKQAVDKVEKYIVKPMKQTVGDWWSGARVEPELTGEEQKATGIKNIQKELTGQIVDRLNSGRPTLNVAGQVHHLEKVNSDFAVVNNIFFDIIDHDIEVDLEHVIKGLEKIVDVRRM